MSLLQQCYALTCYTVILTVFPRAGRQIREGLGEEPFSDFTSTSLKPYRRFVQSGPTGHDVAYVLSIDTEIDVF